MSTSVLGGSKDQPIVIDDEADDVIVLDDDTPPPPSPPRRNVPPPPPPANAIASTSKSMEVQEDISGNWVPRLLRRVENLPDVEMKCAQTQSTSAGAAPSISLPLKRKREDTCQPDEALTPPIPQHGHNERSEIPHLPAKPTSAVVGAEQSSHQNVTALSQRALKILRRQELEESHQNAPALAKTALKKKMRSLGRQERKAAILLSQQNPQSEAATAKQTPPHMPFPQEILGYDAQYRTDIPAAQFHPSAIFQQIPLPPIPMLFPNPDAISNAINMGILPSLPELLFPDIEPPPLPLPTISIPPKNNQFMDLSKKKHRIGIEATYPMQAMCPLPDNTQISDPASCLVFDFMPKKHRHTEFLLRLCTTYGCATPRWTFSKKSSPKALVEFASVEDAMKVFNSPRLAGSDGSTGIRALRYNPIEPVSPSSEKEEGEICSPSATTPVEAAVPDQKPSLPSAQVFAMGASANPAKNGPISRQDLKPSCMETIAKSPIIQQPENTVDGMENDLENLRKRVVASKEANRMKTRPLPAPQYAETIVENGPSPVNMEVDCEAQGVSPPSIASGSSSSSSSEDMQDDFVSAFIADAIRSAPVRETVKIREKIVNDSILDVVEETAKRQVRLEQHIAETKDLMEQYAGAPSKPVRDQIMKLIKAKNSLFDAEKKAFDRRIEEAQAGTARRERLQQYPQVRSFPWPEPTYVTDFILSDDEEDCDMSEG